MIKRRYEGNRLFTLLIGGILLWLVLSLVIDQRVFSRIFVISVFSITILIIFILVVVGFVQGRKKNVTNDSTIPLSAVEYVRFTDHPTTGLDIVYKK